MKWFRRHKAKAQGSVPPIPANDRDREEGGPSYFAEELSQLNWLAVQEAVNLARSDIDPEAWPDYRLAFELERGVAHGYEGLRDRLSNRIGARIRDQVKKLYEHVAQIANVRIRLQDVDRELVGINADWKHQFEDVRADPMQLDRYYQQSSGGVQTGKYAIAMLLVLTEFFISWEVFREVLENEVSAAIFSLGLILLMVVVPHYVAHGLKLGHTRHHKMVREDHKERNEPLPKRQRLNEEMEEKDDRGFRIAAMALGILLVLLVIPLSWARKEEIRGGLDGWYWLPLFFLLQLGISGYFFLREWLDFSGPAANLTHLNSIREDLRGERLELMEENNELLAEYHARAEEVVFIMREAPRWDSYIVECYLKTIHDVRHVICTERPELQPFVVAARIPYLGTKESAKESDLLLDPISEEHRSLESHSVLGREWLYEQLAAGLAELPASSDGAEDDESVIPDDEQRDGAGTPTGVHRSWLLDRTPTALLGEFLKRYCDLDAEYVAPRALRTEDEDTQDEERGTEPDAPSAGGRTDDNPPAPSSDGADEASIDAAPSVVAIGSAGKKAPSSAPASGANADGD